MFQLTALSREVARISWEASSNASADDLSVLPWVIAVLAASNALRDTCYKKKTWFESP